jgi:hypothetical protein
MQSEAGQSLDAILLRKENERRANGGTFYWGVGNAPSTMIGSLSRMESEIPVIFSIMKSRAKIHDSAPSSVVVWRRYIDAQGFERPLPPSALITSRGESGSGARKSKHFALVCNSREPLKIVMGVPFDHRAYRNAGVKGGAIGASQVTALVTPVEVEHQLAEYEANLTATLVEGCWVRLTDPVQLSENQIAIYNTPQALAPSEWRDFVADLRQRSVRPSERSSQLGLF